MYIPFFHLYSHFESNLLAPNSKTSNHQSIINPKLMINITPLQGLKTAYNQSKIDHCLLKRIKISIINYFYLFYIYQIKEC